jgi:hypothetical protein
MNRRTFLQYLFGLLPALVFWRVAKVKPTSAVEFIIDEIRVLPSGVMIDGGSEWEHQNSGSFISIDEGKVWKSLGFDLTGGTKYDCVLNGFTDVEEKYQA